MMLFARQILMPMPSNRAPGKPMIETLFMSLTSNLTTPPLFAGVITPFTKIVSGCGLPTWPASAAASSTPVVTTTWRPPAPPVVPPPREAKPCTVLACEQLSVPGVGGVDEDEELLELDVLELELLELVLELDELLEDELEEELDAGGQVAEPTLPRSRRRLSTMASSPLSTRSTKNEVGVPMLDVTL